MRILSALDSVFANYDEDGDFLGPYGDEDEWLNDYYKSKWPYNVRHLTGTARVDGPDLETHPDYQQMRDAGWRPSKTRDAFIHPKGRVLTVGEGHEFSPKYPGGRKTRWFEQALGEGQVHSRSHEKLTDALTADGWDNSFDSVQHPDMEQDVRRDMKEFGR